MSDDDLVTAKVRTRNPQRYVLVNTADKTIWRMTADGSWRSAGSVSDLTRTLLGMEQHELTLHGPHENPLSGLGYVYLVSCSCNNLRGSLAQKPDNRAMWEAAIVHQAEGRGEELARGELVMRIAEARSAARYRDVEPDAPTE